MNHIRLIAADKEWNASYTIKDGNVCVGSAHGAEREPLDDPEKAEAVALQVFERIIKRRYPGAVQAEFRAARPYSARS